MNTILTILMITVMTYEMPKLPYTNNALEPVISQQTIDYHYGKHLQTYVNNLNNLVPGTEFEGKDLVTIVATAPDGAIFNNAGQVLNHTSILLTVCSEACPAASLPASWQKPSNATSAALRISRRNSTRQLSACSAPDGLGCLPTRTANSTSPKKPTVAIRYAPVLNPLLGFDVWEHCLLS